MVVDSAGNVMSLHGKDNKQQVYNINCANTHFQYKKNQNSKSEQYTFLYVKRNLI